MGVAHVGLVHCDPCECKVKGFRAGSSIERNVSKRRHLQGVRHQRLLSGMGKSKATLICPYIFHLYHSHELLLPAEMKEYRIQEALVKHNVESEEEENPDSPANSEEEESSDNSECESLTPSEIREI